MKRRCNCRSRQRSINVFNNSPRVESKSVRRWRVRVVNTQSSWQSGSHRFTIGVGQYDELAELTPAENLPLGDARPHGPPLFPVLFPEPSADLCNALAVASRAARAACNSAAAEVSRALVDSRSAFIAALADEAAAPHAASAAFLASSRRAFNCKASAASSTARRRSFSADDARASAPATAAVERKPPWNTGGRRTAGTALHAASWR